MRTDMQIQQNVIDQLKSEPFLNAAEIGVAVKDGVVTLSGTVDMFSKKISAESATKKVAGVKAVVENIHVGMSSGYLRTDAEIAQAVVNALAWNTSVPKDCIKIKVEEGVVTMDGEVDWDYQRTAAKQVVENLYGVRQIKSNIMLKPTLTSKDISQKIKSIFHRSATIDSQRIKVEVVDNRVVLTGKVRSLAEKEDANRAAWTGVGVRGVDNKLELMEDDEFLY
jgi:osmotically-inducible protein OsmY